MNEVLIACYWENFKFAKDLAKIYPIEHPKRIEVEKQLNELQQKINIE